MNCTPQECLIPGPAGTLEVLMSCPRHEVPGPMPYAVICHPHSLYGGTMSNKVVYMIASTFNALGAGVVRFNFRGVGNSTGTFDHGHGETEDLRAVVNWLTQHYLPRELWLAGFSFGSFVALRGHHELGASRLLLVAPAVDRFDFSGLHLSPIPTLIIQGALDEVVSPQAVSTWVATQRQSPLQFTWLPQADHFFHGQLNELREIIMNTWNSLL